MTFTLRLFQSNAIENLRTHLRAGKKRLVLCSPTGSGKTEMGFDVVRSALAKGKKVAFVANRIGLVAQTSRRLDAARIEHGILQGDNSRREYMPLLVCSIQTIASRGLPDEFDLLVYDEAHATPGSKDYIALTESHKDAVVIGLTATPFSKGMARHNDKLGGPLFEGIVVAAQYSELTAQGFLVDCDVYAPSEPDMTGAKTQRNASGELDYSDSVASERANTDVLVGNIVDHWLRLAAGSPTVCFACDILHSKHIAQRFVDAGVACEHIDCYTPEDERAAVLARHASGETTIVTNVGILAEGWDFPACRTMILARPTKSLIRFIQMGGRVLRPSPGKDRALILDHSGTVLRLGLPNEDRCYGLNDGKPAETAEATPDEDKIVKCSSCTHVYNKTKSKVCPACGFKPVPQPRGVGEGDGELVLVGGRAKKPPPPTMEDKARFYGELLTAQENRSFGWVAHNYKRKFGVWPRGMPDTPLPIRPETRSWLRSQRIRFAKGQAKGAQANA